LEGNSLSDYPTSFEKPIAAHFTPTDGSYLVIVTESDINIIDMKSKDILHTIAQKEIVDISVNDLFISTVSKSETSSNFNIKIW